MTKAFSTAFALVLALQLSPPAAHASAALTNDSIKQSTLQWGGPKNPLLVRKLWRERFGEASDYAISFSKKYESPRAIAGFEQEIQVLNQGQPIQIVHQDFPDCVNRSFLLQEKDGQLRLQLFERTFDMSNKDIIPKSSPAKFRIDTYILKDNNDGRSGTSREYFEFTGSRVTTKAYCHSLDIQQSILKGE